MHKRMTISIDEIVYEGLLRVIGRRKISQFLEDLARPYVTKDDLDSGYRAMAKDIKREREATEWSESLIRDIPDESR
jgi:predicted CopG family antitoxin